MDEIKLNEDEQKNLLNRVWQDYEFAKAERDKHTDDWANWRKQYDSEWVELTKTEDDEEMRQYLYVPETMKHIHRLECSLQSHFFPQPGPCKLGKVVARQKNEDALEAAEILDKALHAKVDLELNPALPLMQAFHSVLVEGVGVLKGGWDFVRGLVNPETGEAGKPLRNSASVVWVPNDSVMWDPYALRLDDISYFIYEFWLSEEELWQRQAAGIYENVEKVTKGGDEAREDLWRQGTAAPGNKQRRLYKLMEFWGPMQLLTPEALDAKRLRGKHEPARDIVATVYKNKTVLRVDNNSYADLFSNATPYEKLPFWVCTGRLRNGSTYGYSMADILTDLQREVNAKRNQRILAVELEQSGKLFVDTTRVQDLDALQKARHGGIVPVSGPPKGSVEWFEPHTSTQGIVQEEAMLERNIMHITGVTNVDMGSREQGVDTATGMTLLTQQGNVIQQTMISLVAMTGVVPPLKFFAECAKRYLTPEELQEIVGSLTLPPALSEVLGHDYDIEVEAGLTAASRDAQIRNIQYTIQALGQLMNAAPQMAGPAMLVLMPELMRLLRQPEAAAKFLSLAPQEGAQSPAGQQVPGMTGYGNEMAMAQEGRGPTQAEQRALPAGA